MRKAHMLTLGALVAVAMVATLAVQPAVALADSEGPALPGDFAPFGANVGLYVAIFVSAAVAVALGIFFLWLVALWTRVHTSTEVQKGEERL